MGSGGEAEASRQSPVVRGTRGWALSEPPSEAVGTNLGDSGGREVQPQSHERCEKGVGQLAQVWCQGKGRLERSHAEKGPEEEEEGQGRAPARPASRLLPS